MSSQNVSDSDLSRSFSGYVEITEPWTDEEAAMAHQLFMQGMEELQEAIRPGPEDIIYRAQRKQIAPSVMRPKALQRTATEIIPEEPKRTRHVWRTTSSVIYCTEVVIGSEDDWGDEPEEGEIKELLTSLTNTTSASTITPTSSISEIAGSAGNTPRPEPEPSHTNIPSAKPSLRRQECSFYDGIFSDPWNRTLSAQDWDNQVTRRSD